MTKWYEDSKMNNMCLDCDDAYYNQDLLSLENLAEVCFKEGHNQDNENLLQAKYLYTYFTATMDWVGYSFQNSLDKRQHTTAIDAMMKYEAHYEKGYYAIRTALNLLQAELDIKKSISALEKAYLDQFHLSMVVNYTNMLYQNGRIIKSIEELSKQLPADFPMLHGHLGLKLSEYAALDYDSGHQMIIYQKASEHLHHALASTKSYPEKYEVSPLFAQAYDDIIKMLPAHFKPGTLPEHKRKMDAPEITYRTWCASNLLSLNTLNDVHNCAEIGYDPLHLPNMILPVSEGIIPHYHGLFNQIKQEYVSARYLVYDGLTNRETHFSDRDVLLINTLDYPIYGLSVEKVKAAYRSVYSIFDKVAYFLNDYFDIGIKEKDVDYNRLWSPKSKDSKTIFQYLGTNYPLLGMWWLYKDIKNKTISNTQKYIDPVISRISTVRNSMEHRYLKILDFYAEDSHSNYRKDRLADTMLFSDFEYLTIELLKYAREAILLLSMTVHAHEGKRKQNTLFSEIVPSIQSDTYDDEWKRIFHMKL